MRPTRRLLALLTVWLGLGALASWLPALEPVWLAVLAGMVVLVAVDALLLVLTASPRLARQLPPALPIGVWQPAGLQLIAAGRRPVRITVVDLTPPALETEGLPVTLQLRQRQKSRIGYRLRGLRRGDWQSSGCELLLHGRLGLLDQRRFLAAPGPVRVYPNFAAVARYALLATDNRLSQLGIRLRRRRGEGMEFHQLREYREGDSPRQIDWKATSRLRKMIAREYQDERDQQVLLLLDTGFRMRAQDQALSHFDQTLNAALLLAHAVTRQGDAIGLMTFAGHDRFLPPTKGHAAVNRVMNLVFDLEPTLQTPDFIRAAQELVKRLHKRSLVIILTNVRDEDGADLLDACRALGRRHLVLVATLREQLFDALQDTPPATVEDACTLAAGVDYLHLRQQELNRLVHAGALVLDTAPEKLGVSLINRYLDIKRSGRL